MILLIDNYDSFSYNLYQLIGSIRDDIKVARNDEVGIQKIEEMAPEYIFFHRDRRDLRMQESALKQQNICG